MLLPVVLNAQVKVAARPVKPSVPADFCITSDALVLYNMINDFRRSAKQPIIPLSRSLCFVAAKHLTDLTSTNSQDNGCGLHSWSDKGNWKPCCYSKDPLRNECMNTKPKEIAGYPGLGYEIAYWGEETTTPAGVMEIWRNTAISKNIFLNLDKWQSKQWKAAGVAIGGGYALVWLGDKTDSPGDMLICGTDSLVLKSQTTASNTIDKPGTASQAPKEQPEKNAGTKTAETIKEVNLQDDPGSQPKSEHFYLVVASLRDEQMAAEQVKKLKSQGFLNANVIKGDNVFRVIVGEFSNRDEAQKQLNKLSRDFKGIWILRQ